MVYGIVVGARPNYIKMLPIHKRFVDSGIPHIIYNTGQHYGLNMGIDVMGDFPIEIKNLLLGTKSIHEYIHVLQNCFVEDGVGSVICFGDVNSSLCGALAAIKSGLELVHVEAGLRSWENDLPEEKNRVIIDSMADMLFLTEPSARDNLINEGYGENKMFLVGNTMIDTMIDNIEIIKSYKSNYSDYYVLTLHRGYNVDDFEKLLNILKYIDMGVDSKVLYPIHPRVKHSYLGDVHFKNIHIIDPLPYTDFLGLVYYSLGVFTDSGGVQEETSVLGKPCLTFRKNTERPITVDKGSNVLVKDFKIPLQKYIDVSIQKLSHGFKYGLWDGKASNRILTTLKQVGV